MNQQRNFLVTIGEDDQVAPQQSALCLKVFDFDKMEPEGSSTTSPECVGILRIFTNQFPEAKVMALLCMLIILILLIKDLNMAILKLGSRNLILLWKL